MAEKKGIKIAAQNRKAFHDYFVEDRYEAGIELKGTEVKSIRAGTLNLKDSYVIVKNGEANVLSMHISPYDKGNIFNHDPDRPKKLLLHKREINKLYALVKQDGYALIPLSVYFKDARVKVEVGVCKGKKNYDKREDAGKALLGLVGAAVRADHPVLVGHYAGFEVTVAYVPLSKMFVAHLVGQATHTTELGSDAAGNMVRLQNVVAALPQEVSGLRNNLQQLRVQLDSAKEELQQPFLQEQELNDKSARLAELDALLNVGNDAPVLEGEAEVVNEDDSVRTPREENELER